MLGRCIFKIPRSLRNIHHKGYEPEIVSIGPYHHGKEHLKMMDEYKHRIFQFFLQHTRQGVSAGVLVGKIADKEDDIKKSYSEKLDKLDLFQMMVLDGCFILVLFFSFARMFDDGVGIVNTPQYPILTTPWILATIRSDLLLLENQVPFIILKLLLEESNIINANLNTIAFKFFNIKERSRNLEAEHLLDLIRKNFIPVSSPHGSSHNLTETPSSYLRLILSAKRLRLQGIKFIKAKETTINESILEIKLHGHELHIPPILFDGFISSVLLNCVAFEQLSMSCSNDITSYVVFMGCLMNDEAGATYLSEKGIIENYFGNGSDVSKFIKNICKDVAFDMSKSYLKEVFGGINKYTSKRWNVQIATFKHLHFDSPWTILSSSAVLVAILLSLAQTIFGGLSYFHSSSK